MSNNTAAEATGSSSNNKNNPSQDWNVNPELFHALDDVHTRFVLNLPASELASADRIFFQLEQAWWFYEDMICDNGEDAGKLPRYSTLKPFAKLLFDFSPLFPNKEGFHDMWNQFSLYKRKISTYGTILLNTAGTHMILCQTWNGNTWTFPAGKINQGESGIQAAARETFEETGFDPHCLFGETKQWLDTSPNKITWKHPLEGGKKSALTYQEPSTGKRRTCYICHGVPDDFQFAPVARKEVGDIQWFPISLAKDENSDLPKKTFAVLPFMGRLKSWIRRNVKDRPKSRPKSRNKNRKNSSTSRNKQRASNLDDPLVAAGLAQVGDQTRWTEEEMFKANEKLTGKEVDYDGNPHVFSEKGFQGNDPHAFRVVGGSFMNTSTAPTTSEGLSDDIMQQQRRQSQYQPLVSRAEDEDAALKPFFSEEGATPWGAVVEEAKHDGNTTPSPGRSKNRGKKTTKTKNSQSKQDLGQALLSKLQAGSAEEDPLDVLTDSQITKRSQKEKLRHDKYLDDTRFIQEWVSNLPQPKQYRIHVDIDDILNQFLAG